MLLNYPYIPRNCKESLATPKDYRKKVRPSHGFPKQDEKLGKLGGNVGAGYNKFKF